MGEGGAADRDAGTRFPGPGPGPRQDRRPRAARWRSLDQGAGVFARAVDDTLARAFGTSLGAAGRPDPDYARDDPQPGCWGAASRVTRYEW